ncbi:MAG: SulP family inorganic anion transporter [Acidobacteria bacterium]|nr:SulP family inorganic anion transporter [Acidobacteriota bacterium]
MTGTATHGRLARLIPALEWLPGYRRQDLPRDLVAGLTTAAVILPKAMAYAALAGLPVQVGLYTALVPTAVYAVLGSSRRLSVSTTTTLGILTASEIAFVVPDGSPAQVLAAASTLAVMVGAVLLLASVLRLGFLANFISEPVLVGFKAGIGCVIVVDQIPKLLGIHFAKGGFFENVLSIVGHIPETSWPTLAVAAGTLAVMIILPRMTVGIPAPLVAVAAGIGASGLLGLQAHGVAVVGVIPAGLPGLVVPDHALMQQLWPGALGIGLMSFVESIASGRAFAPAGELRPNANQELLATGIANATSGFFGGMPAGGGTSQTAVNSQAGARTQMAGVVTAASTVAVLLFLSPLISLMPDATLAAVVIATSVGLISPRDIRAIREIRRTEAWWAVAAMGGVMVIGTLPGILSAALLSMAYLMYQFHDPPVYVLRRKPETDVFRRESAEHPEDEAFPGLLIVRTEGRIYFGNAQRIADKMAPLIRTMRPDVLIFDCGAVPDIEFTALKMLTEAEERLRKGGTKLWLAALNPAALEIVNRAPLGRTLGRERMYFNVPGAVDAYLARRATTALDK